MADTRSVLKGTLDILVLKALSWGPMHGFDIAAWIDERSGSELVIDDSALYQALHRMEERELIEGEWGVTENNRRARFYSMTPAGRKHLRAESQALVRLTGAMATLLEAKSR